jgi:hypothetical protein
VGKEDHIAALNRERLVGLQPSYRRNLSGDCNLQASRWGHKPS